MSEPVVYQNALDLNSTLGEYRLEAVLGVGGFGITYLAQDSNLEKRVAIKEYLPGDLAVRALDGSVVPVSTDHRSDYQWGLDAFIQEARTLARFSHPHIVRVNRYFEANGTGYMVMDYEDGESLNQLLKRAPFPAEPDLRRILLPLLDGLAAVHAEKFLHRDIKPSNIFLRANGSPVLLDFGAARPTGGATRALTAIVTPGYAPPEQYADRRQAGAMVRHLRHGRRAVPRSDQHQSAGGRQPDAERHRRRCADGRGRPLQRAAAACHRMGFETAGRVAAAEHRRMERSHRSAGGCDRIAGDCGFAARHCCGSDCRADDGPPAGDAHRARGA